MDNLLSVENCRIFAVAVQERLIDHAQGFPTDLCKSFEILQFLVTLAVSLRKASRLFLGRGMAVPLKDCGVLIRLLLSLLSSGKGI